MNKLRKAEEEWEKSPPSHLPEHVRHVYQMTEAELKGQEDEDAKQKEKNGEDQKLKDTLFKPDIKAIQDYYHQIDLVEDEGKDISPVKEKYIFDSIDEQDEGTPDNWIPRNPELIRLTGRHPLNCEPPLDKLLDLGLFTPSSYHYVRNHGPVPNLVWDDHKLEIKG
jgi:nitrate reductase (NAD(P)H)